MGMSNTKEVGKFVNDKSIYKSRWPVLVELDYLNYAFILLAISRAGGPSSQTASKKWETPIRSESCS